jgi:hypothetical protein
VRAKYEELKLYRPPTTDLNVLQEREETNRVYTFLAALDSSYEPIRAQILLSTEKLSFDSVTALVRQEATRRVAMASDSNPKAPVTSYNEYRYFIIFIDDFSNTTWLYLIKNKSEVFSHFQTFINLVETQYEKKN